MDPEREDERADERDDDRWALLLTIGVAAGIILPLLGAVGFFDPWETNYAEVAREMGVRDDYLYPFWKDSYFFSKPVLLFWLTAPLYKLIGAAHPGGPVPALAELCGRLPSALSSLLCVGVSFFACRRLWGRRAALYAGIALSTMPFWAFLSRQAITDMLYVGPASAAFLLLAVALFDDTVDAAGRSGAFLNRVQLLGSETVARLMLSLALVAVAGVFLVWLWKKGRDPLLHASALLFALSCLAKGPVGVGVCAVTLIVTLAILGDWDRLLRPAALSSTALFLFITAPWPIVMSLFEGLDDQRKTWVQRFIMYDLLGRVGAGAHGDRGSFEYYVKYAGFGMFPWSGLLPPALFAAAEARGGRDKAERFTLLVAMWAFVTFAFFTATTTKFHHYIFPLCVPAALLIGKYLADLVDEGRRTPPVVAFISVVLLALIGRDLVQEPWQLIDLFTYHYKSYKPEYYFPADDEWRIGLSAACFGAALVISLGALWDLARLTPLRPGSQADAPTSISLHALPFPLNLVLGKRGASEGFVLSTLLAAVLFAIFAVQVHFNRASQHWSQRALFDTYYSMRKATNPSLHSKWIGRERPSTPRTPTSR